MTGHLSTRARLKHLAILLVVWVLMAINWTAVSEEIYTVRRGDTLRGIAQSKGVSLDRLASRNGLTKNHYVYTGQRLLIPGSSAATTPAAPSLPSPVQNAIDQARVRSGRWRYIVIHHSGVETGTAKGMDRYHREVRHMEHGLAYHFVIGNGNGMGDGEISVGARWTHQLDGGHLASEAQNQYSLGICLVGNFDEERPTPKQMQRLSALVQALMKRCRLSPSAVKTHQQINVIYTRCPGSHFPTKSFLKSLK